MTEPSAASSSSGQTVLVFIKRKHGTVLLHGGHQYYKKREYKSGLSVWDCCQRKLKCRGLLKIKNDRIMEEKPHKCSPDFTKNEKDALLYNLKQKLTTPSFPSVPTTYNHLVGSLKDTNTELLLQIPTFCSLKSSLYRYRNSAAKLPKIQNTNVEQVIVPPDYQHFLLADYTQDNTRIIVFSSEKARQILCELTDFYADGTFKSCSPPFDQLYTIHGDIGSTQNHTNMMPLVYALMSNRKTESYEILFSMIKAQIPDWNPIKFKMDFERAAMKAVTKFFPSVVLKGCYYHYNKAIWAKGRELKLTNAKNCNQRMVALSAVLPLLPQTEIMNGWAYITRHDSEDPNVIKFRTYMERQWLKETFIPVWCVFGEKQRTTNFAEAWHHKLNSAVGKKAPNLMHLLHLLQEDASFYTVQFRQTENDKKPAKKRNEKSKQRDEFIQDSQIELIQGDIGVGHFLEMVRS